jgi:tetratricopeptide (TPR) repeat protein
MELCKIIGNKLNLLSKNNCNINVIYITQHKNVIFMKVLNFALALYSTVLLSVFCYNAQILEAFKPQTSSTLDDLSDAGVKKALSGQYEEAITYYDKILKIDPNSGAILYLKGVALDMLGKSEEAVIYYDKVLDVDPNNSIALNNKALLENQTR